MRIQLTKRKRPSAHHSTSGFDRKRPQNDYLMEDFASEVDAGLDDDIVPSVGTSTYQLHPRTCWQRDGDFPHRSGCVSYHAHTHTRKKSNKTNEIKREK